MATVKDWDNLGAGEEVQNSDFGKSNILAIVRLLGWQVWHSILFEPIQVRRWCIICHIQRL